MKGARASQSTFLGHVRRATLSVLLLVAAPCCTSLHDPEYRRKIATARTQCDGGEIAGVWVSKIKSIYDDRCTLLLRPDGTGRERRALLGQKIELKLTWRYVGGGVWRGKGVADNRTLALLGRLIGSGFTLRYTGTELLRKNTITMVGTLTPELAVFVRADDPAAVEQHLKTR
jgi:hypothetical protein